MRAMIIDTSEICRSGFRLALEGSFDNCIVCEANTIGEALSCLDNHGTDIVILTIDGKLDTTDPAFIRLQEFGVDTPIVVVGNAVSSELVTDTFRHKIKGFLDRASSKEIMIAAIKLILAGGQYFPPEAHLVFNSPVAMGAPNVGENSSRLTRRQREVLRAVSEGKPNKTIAEELGISAGTVKVHISNLMKDLKAKNRTQAVAIANSLNIL